MIADKGKHKKNYEHKMYYHMKNISKIKYVCMYISLTCKKLNVKFNMQ